MICSHCHDPIDLFPDDGGRGMTVAEGIKYRGWYVYDGRKYCCVCWFDSGVAAQCANARQREYDNAQ